ncbi:MAG: serine protease [Verrucomicrobiales bacterium]
MSEHFADLQQRVAILGFCSGLGWALALGSMNAQDALPPVSERESIILIEGEEGRGSGFVVDLDGTQYVYTNAHVLGVAGKLVFETMSGTEVVPVKLVEVAEDRDLARIALSQPISKYPFRLVPDDTKTPIGTTVVAYGDSGGQGIITELEGKVLGVGPTEIEVTAEIVPGNSGGPIIVPGTLNVLAISTRALVSTNVVEKETRFENIRRFGLKPSGVEKWKKTTLSSLDTERKKIAQLQKDNTSLSAVIRMVPTRRGFYLVPKRERAKVEVDEKEFDVQEWLQANRQQGIAKLISSELSKINRSLGYETSKPLKSMVETERLYGAFFAAITRNYDNGVKGVKPESYSWANREAFEAVAKTRREVATEINAYRKRVGTLIRNSPTLGR